MKKDRSFQRGQGFVEYALVIVLVAVVAILVLQIFGISLKDVFCASMQAIGAQPAACSSSLFQDDFTDLSQWTVIKGKWTNKNGQLCGGPGEGQLFAAIDATDYEVVLSGAKLDKGDGYGLFFRSTNFQKVSGYNFQYDKGAGGYLFREWYQGSEFSPHVSVRKTNYDYYSQPHDIKVVVQGSTYTAFVDGQQVYTVTDSTYSTGGIGLRTWDATEVCFDSIQVNPLP